MDPDVGPDQTLDPFPTGCPGLTSAAKNRSPSAAAVQSDSDNAQRSSSGVTTQSASSPAKWSTNRLMPCRPILMRGSTSTTMNGSIRGDGVTARRRCAPSSIHWNSPGRNSFPIDRLFSIGPTTCQIKFRLIHIERRTGAAALGSGNGTFLVTIPCFKPPYFSPLGRFLHRVRVRALTSQTRSLANS